MRQMTVPSFQQAIDVVEAMQPEDQEALIELIRRRLIERRRADIQARNRSRPIFTKPSYAQ